MANKRPNRSDKEKKPKDLNVSHQLSTKKRKAAKRVSEGEDGDLLVKTKREKRTIVTETIEENVFKRGTPKSSNVASRSSPKATKRKIDHDDIETGVSIKIATNKKTSVEITVQQDEHDDKTKSETQKRKKKKKNKKKKQRKGKDTGTETSELASASKSESKKKDALAYLEKWQNDRENWSFKKLGQMWLLQNMYDEHQVPDTQFRTLLAYMEAMRGRARELTQQRANEIMEKADDSSSNESEASDNEASGSADKVKINRARQVLQILG